MSVRHANIEDLVTAVEDRIRTYCGTVREVSRSQVTDRRALVDLARVALRLPAAVVVVGPIDYPGEISAPALPARTINLGILVTVEYQAGFDAGAADLWKVLDELNQAFLPAAARSESVGLPVAVLGNQSGTTLGVRLVPGGWSPIQAMPDGRAGGVYNLLAYDWPRERDT